MTLQKKYLVEKRNVLNEIRANNMTLQELRFFSIYLAKINPREIESRCVRFAVTDFQRIMELGRIDIAYLKSVTDSLLCKLVSLVRPSGGFSTFQLFKECIVDKDELGNWYVEIDAHDKSLPLMFEFKERYFTYQLWNALRLKSSNQLRMYELLKQYEWKGERIISVQELRELLGINENEYPRFGDFRIRVLDACREALSENTDISFTYEPTGQLGRGGKILNLKFTIAKNTNYSDQLSLDDFITHQDVVVNLIEEWPDDEQDDYFAQEVYPFIAEACQNEFNQEEIQVLYNLVIKVVPYQSGKNNMIEIYDYLKRRYDEMKWRATRTDIKNRMGYLKKIIEADL